MLLHVEVHGEAAQDQSQQEEDEAEVSHPLPLRALALVALPDLLELPDHVVGEEEADVGGEYEEYWC